jgi:phi13 family phage major tail protein
MPDTPNQIIGEIISCDNLYIAPVTADTAAAYTVGTPEPFAPVGEVKYDPKVSAASSSYDGIVMFNYLNEGIAETTVTISGLAEKVKAKVTGKSYDATTGMIYDSGDLSHTPEYALGYRVEIGTGTGTFLYFWLLKGKFYLSAAMDAKTKGEKIDPQATEVTFLPTRTIHPWSVPDPSDSTGTNKISIGQKRVIGDTSDTAFTTADDWFTAVQTPPEAA